MRLLQALKLTSALTSMLALALELLHRRPPVRLLQAVKLTSALTAMLALELLHRRPPVRLLLALPQLGERS